jgi:hypothetical protein
MPSEELKPGLHVKISHSREGYDLTLLVSHMPTQHIAISLTRDQLARLANFIGETLVDEAMRYLDNNMQGRLDKTTNRRFTGILACYPEQSGDQLGEQPTQQVTIMPEIE